MGEIMIDLLQGFIGLVFIIIAAIAVYIGAVVQEESRKGKRIPLFWEKDSYLRVTKRKVFDKSDIKYRDGDNT
jgi:hypothetical protein|tara:strand:+ start:99 stop:317 length:219 start_codon:yes stop_codon:yes gene_type:complete